MVQNRYSLTAGQARICRAAAFILWIMAGLAALSLPIFWLATGGEIALVCDTDASCAVAIDRAAMLPEGLAAAVRNSPELLAAFEASISAPGTRILLAVLVTIRILPYFLLFAGVAMAVQRLGTQGSRALSAALPWLKRAAIAAVAVAIVPILVDAIRGGMLAAQLTGDGFWLNLDIDIVALGINLLLAIGALSVSWALEAGMRATRDAEGFV